MDPFRILLVIILSIGCTQGLFFGLQLVLNPSLKLANKILGTLLLLFSYKLLNQILLQFGIGKYDTWYHLTLELSWAYGALIYYYVKSQTLASFQFSKKDLLHFIPLGLQVVVSIYVRSQNFYWDGTRESLSWLGYHSYDIWMNYTTVPVIATLLILTYAYRAQQLLTGLEKEDTNPQQFKFIHQFLRGTLFIYLLVGIIYLADFSLIVLINQADYYYFTRYFYNPFLIATAILTYWLSFRAYKQRSLKLLQTNTQISDPERLQLEQIASKLHALMETQQVYQQPELTLSSLAEMLAVKPYQLSNTLKVVEKTTFYQYLAKLRIAEFERQVLDAKQEQYSLLGLAFNAGFNSKSSFNRAIKRYSGMTPRQYAAHLKKINPKKGVN